MPSQQCIASSFTTSHNGRANKLINKGAIAEAISVDNVKPSKQGFGGSVRDIAPHIAPREYDCLWDTGATNSAISEKVITECNLKPIGMVEVHSASGSQMREVFLVSIFLASKVALPTVRVTSAVLKDCDVLIGMDVIGQGDFAVTNHQGKTTFSFRIPSLEKIDFVEGKPRPAPTKAMPKVGRNDPCPCGSGKKYKKCCGFATV